MSFETASLVGRGGEGGGDLGYDVIFSGMELCWVV